MSATTNDDGFEASAQENELELLGYKQYLDEQRAHERERERLDRMEAELRALRKLVAKLLDRAP